MTSIARALRLVVLALLLAIPLPATAFQVTVDGITYELSTLVTSADASLALLQLQPWWSGVIVPDPAAAQGFVDAFLGAGGSTNVDFLASNVYFAFGDFNTVTWSTIRVSGTTDQGTDYILTGFPRSYVIASVVPAAVPEIDGNALARALFVLLAFGLWLRGRRRAAALHPLPFASTAAGCGWRGRRGAELRLAESGSAAMRMVRFAFLQSFRWPVRLAVSPLP